MYELRSREELSRAILGNEIVFVEYYIPGNRDSEIFSSTIRDLEKGADPNILFCRVNVVEHPELVKTPRRAPYLEVYYRGRIVFEHHGSLSTIELNLEVLKRGIRSVFRGLEVNIRI